MTDVPTGPTSAVPAQPSTVATDAVKQQVDILAQWSRFYHDAEIRVNSTSVVIAAIAAIGDKFTAGSLSVVAFGIHLNGLGIIVTLASVAAFVSTLGYWRYYELCDLLGKKYRDVNLPKHIQDAVHAEFEIVWKRYGVLRMMNENAHHLVWLVIQVVLIALGVVLTFFSK